MERKEAMKKLPSIPKEAVEDLGFGVRDNPFGEIALNLPIPSFGMGKHRLTEIHSTLIAPILLSTIISRQIIEPQALKPLVVIQFLVVIEKTAPHRK